MRIFGSLLAWVMPSRVFEEVAGNGPSFQDVLSCLIGTGLVYAGLFAALPVPDPGSFFAGFLGGFFFIGVINLLLCFGVTWAHAVALRDHEVDGRELNPDSGQLFALDLHVYPVLLTTGFVAGLAQTGGFIALAVLVMLRTTDLQARALQELCRISYEEGIKAAVVLMLILVGPLGVLAFLAS